VRTEKYGFTEIKKVMAESERDITDEVKKITSKTLLEMKKHAQKIVRGHSTIPNLDRSFNYDVKATKSEVTGEVGADIEKVTPGGGMVKEPGSLDFIIEFGTPWSAPIPHWGPAEKKQVPLWEKYLEDAAEGVLDDRKAR
jgi:hypothetical protein